MNVEQNQIALFTPLLFGFAMMVLTLVIHALTAFSAIALIQSQFQSGRAGIRTSRDVPLTALCVMMFMCACLLEMAVWAVGLMTIGEFHAFAPAFYHSAVNYTTLGYGDILMSPRWRLLGPLESTVGMLMFGLSTALLFAIIIRLAQLRGRGRDFWDIDEPSRETSER